MQGRRKIAEHVAVFASSMKCIRFDVCKQITPHVAFLHLPSSMKCIRFDVCKAHGDGHVVFRPVSSMKCIRFDVCKRSGRAGKGRISLSSMKCIRFDVCKVQVRGPGEAVARPSSMKCIRFDVCKAGSNLWYHWRFSRQNCERWRTATSSNMAISILRSTEPLYSHCECLVAHSGAIQISQKTIGAIAVFVDVSSSSSR